MKYDTVCIWYPIWIYSYWLFWTKRHHNFWKCSTCGFYNIINILWWVGDHERKKRIPLDIVDCSCADASHYIVSFERQKAFAIYKEWFIFGHWLLLSDWHFKGYIKKNKYGKVIGFVRDSSYNCGLKDASPPQCVYCNGGLHWGESNLLTGEVFTQYLVVSPSRGRMWLTCYVKANCG